jgi:hypothetical protein
LQHVFGILSAIGIAEAKGKHFAFEMLEKMFLSQKIAVQASFQIGYDHVFLY